VQKKDPYISAILELKNKIEMDEKKESSNTQYIKKETNNFGKESIHNES